MTLYTWEGMEVLSYAPNFEYLGYQNLYTDSQVGSVWPLLIFTGAHLEPSSTAGGNVDWYSH